MAILKNYEFCSRFGVTPMPLSTDAEKEIKNFFQNPAEEHHKMLNKAHLTGEIYGRPGFEDGDLVVTSRIISIKREAGAVSVITNSGTEYRLADE